jgi:hypothetical protein
MSKQSYTSRRFGANFPRPRMNRRTKLHFTPELPEGGLCATASLTRHASGITGSNDPSSKIAFRRSDVTSLAFLVASPFLALVPSAVLFLLAARARHRLVTAAAAAWLLYAGYEWLMLHRVLCSGDCNIRIDLLILHPALIGLTIIALIVGLMRSRRSDVRGH